MRLPCARAPTCARRSDTDHVPGYAGLARSPHPGPLQRDSESGERNKKGKGAIVFGSIVAGGQWEGKRVTDGPRIAVRVGVRGSGEGIAVRGEAPGGEAASGCRPGA